MKMVKVSFNSIIILSLRLIFFKLHIGELHAYPNGAGHCEPGGDLSTLSSFGHGPGGGSRLERLDLEIVAEPIFSAGSTTLVPSEEVTLAADERQILTLKTVSGSSAGFKGFLFRISGRNGEDASSALSLVPSMTSDTQLLDYCGDDASGISHTKNDVKDSIEVEFYFREQGKLLLEVTVVQDNNPYPQDGWAFSSYRLNIDGSRRSSIIPTAVPSDVPTSFIPTLSPMPSTSRIPTDEPTISSAPSSSAFPSTLPSVSSMPSTEPSDPLLPWWAWVSIGGGVLILCALRMPLIRLLCLLFKCTIGCIIQALCSCCCSSSRSESDLFDQEERGGSRELSSVCYDDIVLTTIKVENSPTVGKPNRVTFSESSTKSSSTAVFIRKLNKIEEHVLRGQKWNTYEAEKLDPEQAQILINEESENDVEKSFDSNFNRKVLFTIHGFSTKPHSHLARCQLYGDKFQKFKLIPIIWPCRSLTEPIEEKDSGPEACLNIRNIERVTGLFSKSIMVHGIENRLLRKFAHSSLQFEHIFMVAPDLDKDLFSRKYTEANKYEEWRRDGLRIKDSLMSEEGGKIHILYNKKDSHLNAFLQARLGRCGAEGEMPQRIKNHIVNIDTERYRKSHPHYYQWDDDVIAFYERKYSRQRVSFTASASASDSV